MPETKVNRAVDGWQVTCGPFATEEEALAAELIIEAAMDDAESDRQEAERRRKWERGRNDVDRAMDATGEI